MEKWLLISELSEKTGIPESTVRRYTNTFKAYFRYSTKGRGKKFDPEAIEILNRISSLYKDDYQVQEIEEILGKDFAFTVETEEATTQPPIKSIERQFEEFKQQQEQFNQSLMQQLEKQSNYIKESINKRDQQLLNAISEMQEARKIAASQEPRKKKKWWKFGK